MEKLKISEKKQETKSPLLDFFRNKFLQKISLILALTTLPAAANDFQSDPPQTPITSEKNPPIFYINTPDTISADCIVPKVSEVMVFAPKGQNLVNTFKFTFSKLTKGNKLFVDENNKIIGEPIPAESRIFWELGDTTETVLKFPNGQRNQKWYDKHRQLLEYYNCTTIDLEKDLPWINSCEPGKKSVESLSLGEDTTLLNIVWENANRELQTKEGSIKKYKYFQKQAEKAGLPLKLQEYVSLGIPFVESSFDERKISEAGATGTYQLMKGRAKELKIAYSDRNNDVVIGEKVMNDFLKRYQNFCKNETVQSTIQTLGIQQHEEDILTYLSIDQWNWGMGRAKRVFRWFLEQKELHDQVPKTSGLEILDFIQNAYKESGVDSRFGTDSDHYLARVLAATALMKEKIEAEKQEEIFQNIIRPKPLAQISTYIKEPVIPLKIEK